MYKNAFDKAAEENGSVQPQWRFLEITNTSPDYIVGQLVGHDRVHVKGARSVDEIRRCRLGGDGYDRTCFALAGTDGTVHSAIYVYKMFEKVKSDVDYHGDVAGILAQDSIEDKRDPKALIFYSISNITNVMGAGQRLVGDLYSYLTHNHPYAKRSTLSPLRDFDEKFSPEEAHRFEALNTQEKMRRVLDHILSASNPVQNFHLGNGARIADIKLDAGDLSVDPVSGTSRRHAAMVNFAYDVDADTLRTNAQNYVAIKKLLRNTEMDPLERSLKIRSSLAPLVSEHIWRSTGLNGHARFNVGQTMDCGPQPQA